MELPRPSPGQTKKARKLRMEMSESQRKLWQELRANRIGFKFKREHPLGPYALDFYCHEALLCVEVDGEQHDPERDAERDVALLSLGVKTLRFTSRECFFDPSLVANNILLICIERTGRDPFPDPQGR